MKIVKGVVRLRVLNMSRAEFPLSARAFLMLFCLMVPPRPALMTDSTMPQTIRLGAVTLTSTKATTCQHPPVGARPPDMLPAS